MLQVPRSGLVTVLMMVLPTTACISTASVRVRAGGGRPQSAQAKVRVDPSLVGTVASLLEHIAGQSEPNGILREGQSETWVKTSPAGASRAPERAVTSGGSVASDRGFGAGGQESSKLAEMPDFSTVEVGPSAGIPDTTVATDSSAAAYGSGSGAAAAAVIPPGYSLVDLLGRGVMVGGVRVQLGDIRPLSSFAWGSSGSDGAEAFSMDFGRSTPLRAFAALSESRLPADGGETHLVVGLRGGDVPRGRVRLHLVLDSSQSMAAIWPEVMTAARGMIESLQPQDVLHIVTYGSRAAELLPPTVVGDGTGASQALSTLRVGGYTDIGAGLELAYRAVGQAHDSASAAGDSVIVILVSDGVPNVGAFGPAEVSQLATQARVDLGCTTSVVGLGPDFDTDVLRAVSSEGRGGFHVATTAAELLPALTAEVSTRDQVAARQVDLRVALPGDVQVLGVHDAHGGARQVNGGVELSLPAVYGDEERQLVVRLGIGPRRVSRESRESLESREVAAVSVGFLDGRGTERQARQSLSVALGEGPFSSQGSLMASFAVVDAELSAALDEAKESVRQNDGAAAAAALRAHEQVVRQRFGGQIPDQLDRRLRTLDRVASALAQLCTGAPAADRGLVIRGLGSLSIRLGR